MPRDLGSLLADRQGWQQKVQSGEYGPLVMTPAPHPIPSQQIASVGQPGSGFTITRAPGFSLTPYPTTLPTDPLAIWQLLASLTKDVRDLMAAQIQEGLIWAAHLNVTGAVTPSSRFVLNPPLFTLAVTNDGNTNAQFRIPDAPQAPWSIIQPSEVQTVSFPTARIASIAFQASANPAILRLLGTN